MAEKTTTIFKLNYSNWFNLKVLSAK